MQRLLNRFESETDVSARDVHWLDIQDDCWREAVTAFEERYRSFSDAVGINWAAVDRDEGLLMASLVHQVGLFVRSAVCGFDGDACRATVRILAMIGFGSEDELRRRLSCGQLSAVFVR